MHFDEPTAISDLELMFPALRDDLLPSLDIIPDAFAARHLLQAPQAVTRWFDLAERWFFRGFERDELVHIVDEEHDLPALRHLHALIRSSAPHEHKLAAVAWLASLWLRPDWASLQARRERIDSERSRVSLRHERTLPSPSAPMF